MKFQIAGGRYVLKTDGNDLVLISLRTEPPVLMRLSRREANSIAAALITANASGEFKQEFIRVFKEIKEIKDPRVFEGSS